MDMKEEPPFDIPKIPNIVTIIVMVVALIVHIIQYRVAGDWSWWIYRRGLFLIVFFGIIVPVALLVLVLVGKEVYQNSEYITLSFGIVIVVGSSALSGIATYWTIRDIIHLVADLEYGIIVTVCYVILISCIVVALVMQIKSMLGGIKLIKYNQGNI